MTEGSLFDSAYRLRLAPDADLAALEADAEARFADQGLQWRDRRDGAPGVGRFVDRLAAFLILLGLAGLAVGGIGVAAAVRAHLDGQDRDDRHAEDPRRQRRHGLRDLSDPDRPAGARRRRDRPRRSAPPCRCVAAPLAAGRLPVPAEFGLYPRPLAEAALYGLLTALVFSLWPLARVRDIRPAALFRDEAAPARALAAPGAGARHRRAGRGCSSPPPRCSPALRG